MIGKTYPSESLQFKDPLTGRMITKLTSKYQNYHLYFTENSFTTGDEEIVFLSSRPYEDRKCFNYFSMNLKSGVITQLTDEPNGIDNGHTKTPESRYLLYVCNNSSVLKLMDTKTGEATVMYVETDPSYEIEQPSFSCDHRYIGVVRNEQPKNSVGDNYTGFKETMFATKISQIILIPIDQPGKPEVVWTDTHWIGHLQFSPQIPTLLSFCHEGPWNYVQQRIWLFDTVTRMPVPCFRQKEDDSVGHEFWTRNNMIFFDNRKAGHDGTITVNRNQAVTQENIAKEKHQVPYVGLADIHGNVVRTIPLPYYCNHYHANIDNTLLVGDDVDNLVLIDISGEKSTLKNLCYHGTSWNGQLTHCHPTWSWTNKYILYEAERDQKCNLYLLEM
ncbi:MAG: oligogalacturonate lyase family protein [Sphaerochaetaceae bacterium]|jgi:oligogalacturonide lyase